MLKSWEINLTELSLEGEENSKKICAIEKAYVNGHLILKNAGDSLAEFLCGDILVEDKVFKNLLL